MGDGITHLYGSVPGNISLRPFQLSDIDYVMEWMSDDLVANSVSWEAVTTRDDALQYMKTTILPHPRYRAICLENTPVGFISVTPLDGPWRCRAVLSSALARKHWGRGIGQVALKMEMAAVLHEWPHLERLDALVLVGNRASSRAPEKAGFRKEAVHERCGLGKGGSPVDLERYCFLRIHSGL